MCDMLWPGSDGLVSLSDVTFLTTCSSEILFLNRLIPLGLFLEYLYQFIYSNVSVWCVNFCSPRPDQVTGEWHDWLSRHLSPNYPGSPSRWCIVTLVTAWQSSHSLYLILTSSHRVIRRGGQTEQGGRCQPNAPDPSHAVLTTFPSQCVGCAWGEVRRGGENMVPSVLKINFLFKIMTGRYL